MKTFRPELQTRFDAGQITLTQCARIVRPDGKVFRATAYHKDLLMSNGQLYTSSAGYKPTATEASSAFSPGTVDVQGILQAFDIDRVAIRAGLFSGSKIFIFETDYNDPVEDDIKRMSGFWGEVTVRNGYFVTEFIGLKDLLAVSAGRIVSPACQADLFDTTCKVTRLHPFWAATSDYEVLSDVDATVGDIVRPTVEGDYIFKCIAAGTSGASEPTWPTTSGGTVVDGTVTWEAIYGYVRTFTVLTVTDNQTFTVAVNDFPTRWFKYGYAINTVGNNTEVGAKEIFLSRGSTGEVQLISPFPFPIEVGDTMELTVGCRKRFEQDCIDKFENESNFQGFPHVPTTDRATKFGGQP